jgi:hypothetical protein
MTPKTISCAMACTAALFYSANAFAGDATTITSGTDTADAKNTPSPIVQTTPVSHDIISVDTTYTGESNVRNATIRGKQDSTYTDFNYGHRFQIEGNWYMRLGVEYQRYDFGGSVAPLPQHLQSLNAIIAYEYVVQDFSAVALELRPGWAYENDITGKDFEIPFDIYTSFQIKKDKVFGMIGAFYGGADYKPTAIPIGGVIWVINDKTRLEALFPRPGLIYNVTDNLELRAGGEISGWGFRQDANPRDAATYSGGSEARVQYSYYEAGLTATYKGWKPFDIALGGGWDFDREFDYIHEVPEAKYHASGAPYIKLSFTAKF